MPNQSNPSTLVRFNGVITIVATTMVINTTASTTFLNRNRQDILDEYGFIHMSAESRKERIRFFARLRYYKGGGTAAIYNQCKDLCKFLPHSKRGEHISFSKTGFFWCKECTCIMKSPRCHCCGNLGRKEPRHRNRDNVKRIE